MSRSTAEPSKKRLEQFEKDDVGAVVPLGNMDESSRRLWPRAVILAGAVYLLIGMTFAALAASASSNQTRTAWRLSAWLISALVFGSHIWYEHSRLRSARVRTAFHASLAVALGALGVAVSAIIRAEVSVPSHRGPGVLAFLIWPILIAAPAFVVALAAAALLSLRKRGVSAIAP